MHNVDTVNNIYDIRLQLHILANSIKKIMPRLSTCANFVYNAGRNILELNSVLAQVQFAISKKKLNI